MNTTVPQQNGMTPRKLQMFELEQMITNLRNLYEENEDEREDTNFLSNIFQKIIDANPMLDVPHDDTLKPYERRKGLEEFDRYGRLHNISQNLRDIEERYFSIVQEHASQLIPNFEYGKDYLTGQLVRHSPQPNPDEWEKVVRNGEIRWKSKITKKVGQPPTKVRTSRKTANEIDLYANKNVYWMCYTGFKGASGGNAEELMKISRDKSLEPGLDYTWMDGGWFDGGWLEQQLPEDKRGTHWPGNKHWVFIGVEGTGSYNSSNDSLLIAHSQVWYTRASILSKIITMYHDLPAQVTAYKFHGPFSKKNNYHKEIIEKQKNAFDILSRYINDFDELAANTVQQQLSQDAMKIEDYDKKYYQFFYPQDFKYRTKVRGEMKWLEYDQWGPAKYSYHDKEGKKHTFHIRTANLGSEQDTHAVHHMESILADQDSSLHQVFIRESNPTTEYNGRIEDLPSPDEYWKHRSEQWRKIYKILHKPIETYYKLSYQLNPGTLDESQLERYGIEAGKFLMDVRHALLAWGGNSYQGGPPSDSTLVESGQLGVKRVREWVRLAIDYFLAQKDFQKDISHTDSFNGMGTSMDNKREALFKIRPKKAALSWMMRSFYNGSWNNYAAYDLKENDFYDAEAGMRVLFFKTCMLYRLCTSRRWLSTHGKFETLYNRWKPTFFCTKEKRVIPLECFDNIWPVGPNETADQPKYEWVFTVLLKRRPIEWAGFDNNPLRWKVKNQAIFGSRNPAVAKDCPRLHFRWKNEPKIGEIRKKDDVYYQLQSYWITFLSRYKIAGNNTLQDIGRDLRNRHIAYIRGYLPKYRIYQHPKYGPLVFARLKEQEEDRGYKKDVLHVAAFCVEQKYEGETFTVDDDPKQDFVEFQWFIPGFGPNDDINAWLSGTRNQVTQVLNKLPHMGYNHVHLTLEMQKKLRDIYTRHDSYISDLLKQKMKAWQQQEEHINDLDTALRKAQDEKAALEKQIEDNKQKTQALEQLISDAQVKNATKEKDIIEGLTKDS